MAKNNQKQISVSRILTPIALAITLAACSSKPPEPEFVDITSAPAQSVQAYLIKADSSKGSIQNDWLIMALKAAIDSGDTQQSSLILSRLEKQQLSTEQKAEWLLLRAKHNLLLERPEVALEQLYFEPWWKLTDTQWREYHSIRQDAHEMTGDYFSASVELSALYELSSDNEQAELSAKTWEYLGQYSELELGEFTTAENDWITAGWLELSQLMQTFNGDVLELKPKLEAWMNTNVDHPAFTYTPQEIQDILALEIVEPRSTALLLPLSGKYAKAAQLVRDGFFMAMLEDKNRENDAVLTVIDTETFTTEEIDIKLTEERVDFIVGPLVKTKIEEIQALQATKETPVPMLALNQPTELNAQNTCYLTLSPEQEAAQGAKYLKEQGFQYPLILAPKGSLGTRVAEAFKTEWKKKSTTDVVVSYFGSKAQLQQNIDKVFGLKESQSRIYQMDALLELEIENQPRSRRDIDSVYIVAKSSELTLIKPFIEVAINPEAKPPGLYANSRANNGTKRQFEDLSGVIYSDIPLLIEKDEILDAQLNELWPEMKNDQKRFQALGMDAYMLINELPKLKVVPEYQVDGQTGILTMGEQCIIQRQLSWSEFDAL